MSIATDHLKITGSVFASTSVKKSLIDIAAYIEVTACTFPYPLQIVACLTFVNRRSCTSVQNARERFLSCITLKTVQDSAFVESNAANAWLCSDPAREHKIV